MHFVVHHYFFGYSLTEWVALLTILTILIGSVKWLSEKVKESLKSFEDNIFGPFREQLSELNSNIESLNKQYKAASERLENGDKKFIVHDEQLKDHERRITHLEEHQ